jgi:regulatory protein
VSGGGQRPGRLPVITAIGPDPRRAGAVRIEVDRAPFASISQDLVAEERLAPGRELDDPLRERIGLEAEIEGAFRTVLKALERRSFARADLGRRLRRKGHAPEAVDAALERAGELRLLDDAAFARNYVETRAGRGRGPARLLRDLAAMGVERRLIDHAIAAHFDQDVDRAAIPLTLATKRAGQLGDLPREVKRRRVLAYLARRGFSGRDITDLVGRVLTQSSIRLD